MQYHTQWTENQETSFKSGLEKAISLAQVNNKELLIYTGNKNIFDSNIVLNVLGEKNQKKLLKDRRINIYDITIFLEFENSKKSTFKKGVILTPFATSYIYTNAINDSRCVDFIYTPWMEDEYKDYIKKYPKSTSI